MMAVLNSHNEFFVPAVTPVLFSLCVIASLALGARRWGGTAMAWGVLAGGAAQIIFQYPRYRRHGYLLEPLLRFDDPAFRRVMKRWIPVLVTSSLFTVNHQIAMLLASTLADKSTSALFYAIVFWQLPFGLFSVSITTVLFPKMSRQAARRDREGLAESVGFGYRNLAALLIPSAAILIVLGAPIVAVAFQRRAFTSGDTMLTARVLAAYAWGMPFVGLFNISQRALFALGELRRPFYAALITVVTDIGLSIVFLFGFDGNVVSLAWANSLAFVVGAAVQYLFLRSRTPLRLRGMTIRTGWKVLLVTALAVVIMKVVLYWTGDSWWRDGSDWRAFGILAAIGLSTLALIVALYAWLRVEAVSIIIKRTPKGEAG
jgi:putative peptidoglycan lipid II flippase